MSKFRTRAAVAAALSLLCAAPAMAMAGGKAHHHHAFDVQAHRGGLGLTTESTLEGFKKAMELGVTTLELDVQITEDRYAVVTHDRRVSASKCRDTAPVVAGDPEFPYVGKYVKDLKLAQVRTLDCSLPLAEHPGQERIEGARMPLLRLT